MQPNAQVLQCRYVWTKTKLIARLVLRQKGKIHWPIFQLVSLFQGLHLTGDVWYEHFLRKDAATSKRFYLDFVNYYYSVNNNGHSL